MLGCEILSKKEETMQRRPSVATKWSRFGKKRRHDELNSHFKASRWQLPTSFCHLSILPTSLPLNS